MAALAVALPAGLTACGGTTKDVAIVDASTGGVSAAPTQEYSVWDATYYVPVYSGEAEYAGSSEDREADAIDSLDLWRELEARDSAGVATNGRAVSERAVGERSIEDRMAALEESPEFDDGELDEIVDSAEEEIGALGLDAPEPDGELLMLTPVYSELATLCGDAGAIGIYAAGSSQDQPVLQQYEQVVAIDVEHVPAGIQSAWEFNAGPDMSGYAWQASDAPEVVVVVTSAASGCSLPELANQVGIERGE